jgi:ankyrin repeat protein
MDDLSLIEAVKAGDYDRAEKLIQMGADINQQDEQGWTPLSFAAGKSDLAIVKLLFENGADVFKVGQDCRTPYMIALAAGRLSIAKYLSEAESQYAGRKPVPQDRKYCKAYLLEELRKFPKWNESRINWKKGGNGNGAGHENGDSPLTNDKIVFLHQDLTVTESVWHDENVIFNQIDPAWQEFCADSLKFKVPDDFDLISPQ